MQAKGCDPSFKLGQEPIFQPFWSKSAFSLHISWHGWVSQAWHADMPACVGSPTTNEKPKAKQKTTPKSQRAPTHLRRRRRDARSRIARAKLHHNYSAPHIFSSSLNSQKRARTGTIIFKDRRGECDNATAVASDAFGRSEVGQQMEDAKDRVRRRSSTAIPDSTYAGSPKDAKQARVRLSVDPA